MRPRSVSPAVALVLVVACGGPSAPDDPARIVVPPQPPQVVTVAPTPAPPASASSTPVAAPPFTCKTGKPFEANSRTYCAYPESSTWDEAEARCVANGGHLMAFESRAASEELHLALGSPARAGRAAWIGLENPTKAKTAWKWSTGEPVVFSAWNASEPNNWDGNEACAEWLVATGRWNDTRCNLVQPYLCQSVGKTPLNCLNHKFEGKDVTYCYVGSNASFAAAKAACKQMGGQLATPRNAEQNEALRAGMGQRFEATRMWIGLNDLAEERTWMWTTGAKPRFTAWATNEPNAYGREACVELYADRWTWNDLDCSDKLPSVCESPKKP